MLQRKESLWQKPETFTNDVPQSEGAEPEFSSFTGRPGRVTVSNEVVLPTRAATELAVVAEAERIITVAAATAIAPELVAA